ncbi:uncharacterized protein PAC_03985 [Phialocephala subalpina]|uniref:F-box domain-containing protein n=1 Tax=Phialocephala subalpina TaxID=576137 RepID=A0A1L7WMU2_9HELO|nr:uncharacterized protein PAC_03985 [Phialocephala subalpina]
MSPTKTDILSNELWDGIMGFVSRYDLPNISRVSKHFRDLVKSHLYAEVDLVKNTHESSAVLKSFLRSIIKNPERGSLVKRITLGAMYNKLPIGFQPIDKTFLDEIDVIGLLRQVIDDSDILVFCVDHYYPSITKERKWDSVVGFLLLLVSKNLQHLTLHIYDETECSNINAVVQFLAGFQPTSSEASIPFDRLSKIELFRDTRDSDGGTTTVIYQNMFYGRLDQSMLLRQPCMPFIGLPSVRRVVGGQINSIYLERCGPELAASMPNIKSLELQSCDTTPLVLSRFFDRFPNLERFKWATHQLDLIDTHPLAAIGSSVQRLKSSLKEIIINENSRKNEPRLVSLVEFTSLKTLEIDSFTALGKAKYVTRPDRPAYLNGPTRYPKEQVEALIAALPTSLEHLKITNGPKLEDLVHYVPEILAAKRKNLVNLKQLTLTGKGRYSQCWVDMEAAYGMKVAEEEDVKLEYVDTYDGPQEIREIEQRWLLNISVEGFAMTTDLKNFSQSVLIALGP